MDPARNIPAIHPTNAVTEPKMNQSIQPTKDKKTSVTNPGMKTKMTTVVHTDEAIETINPTSPVYQSRIPPKNQAMDSARKISAIHPTNAVTEPKMTQSIQPTKDKKTSVTNPGMKTKMTTVVHTDEAIETINPTSPVYQSRIPPKNQTMDSARNISAIQHTNAITEPKMNHPIQPTKDKKTSMTKPEMKAKMTTVVQVINPTSSVYQSRIPPKIQSMDSARNISTIQPTNAVTEPKMTQPIHPTKDKKTSVTNLEMKIKMTTVTHTDHATQLINQTKPLKSKVEHPIQPHQSNSAECNYFSSSTQKSKTLKKVTSNGECSEPEKSMESRALNESLTLCRRDETWYKNVSLSL